VKPDIDLSELDSKSFRVINRIDEYITKQNEKEVYTFSELFGQEK